MDPCPLSDEVKRLTEELAYFDSIICSLEGDLEDYADYCVDLLNQIVTLEEPTQKEREQ